MRCLVAVVALLGLAACGGEVTDEELQAPGSTQEAAAEPASGEVSEEALCSNSWECFCAQFKTEETCRTAYSKCVWYYSRCQPTYE